MATGAQIAGSAGAAGVAGLPAGTPAGTPSYPDWEYAVLSGLGAPNTPTNLTALQLWAQSEGVNPNNNNWLATTLKGAAYPTSGVVAENGGDAVPAYASQATGVAATVATIQGYPNIVAALKSGSSLSAIYSAINGSAWCKGCQGGNYPTALNAALGGAAPGSSSTSSTGASSDDCLWSLPLVGCVLSRSEAKALLGGVMVASGVIVIGLGVVLVAAFGIAGTRVGGQAKTLAKRIPGPVGAAAKATGRRSAPKGGSGASKSSTEDDDDTSSTSSSSSSTSKDARRTEYKAGAHEAAGAHAPGRGGRGASRSGKPEREDEAQYREAMRQEKRNEGYRTGTRPVKGQTTRAA